MRNTTEIAMDTRDMLLIKLMDGREFTITVSEDTKELDIMKVHSLHDSRIVIRPEAANRIKIS